MTGASSHPKGAPGAGGTRLRSRSERSSRCLKGQQGRGSGGNGERRMRSPKVLNCLSCISVRETEPAKPESHAESATPTLDAPLRSLRTGSGARTPRRLGRGRNEPGMWPEMNRMASSPLHQGFRAEGEKQLNDRVSRLLKRRALKIRALESQLSC